MLTFFFKVTKSIEAEGMRGRGGEVGMEGRIKRAGRSSRNGTCPKVSLNAAIALHSAPGKLIYKFRDGPRVARLLRRETEQRRSCSREAGSEGTVLMWESGVSFQGCKPLHLFPRVPTQSAPAVGQIELGSTRQPET